MITFTVPGEPVAKARARITITGGRAHAYTPAKTAAYEQLVAKAGRDAMAGQKPLTTPLIVSITIHRKIPASWPKNRRQAALDGLLYPTTTPDADNYAKAALDGLNGIVWEDDAQVVSLTVHKRYSASPCTILNVTDLVI